MKRKKLALFSEVVSTRTLENGTAIHSQDREGNWSWGEKHTEGRSQSQQQQSCLHSQNIIKACLRQVTRMAYVKKCTDGLHRIQHTKYRLLYAYPTAWKLASSSDEKIDKKIFLKDKLSFLGICRHKYWDIWSLICGKHTIVHCSHTHTRVYIFKCILGATKCQRFFCIFKKSRL